MPEYVRLSQIYKEVPLSERICGKDGQFFQEGVGCRKPILRNATLIDGVIMHFGCFKKSYFEPTHMCNGCGSFLSPKKIVTVDFRGESFKGCGLCGTTDIIKLGWNRQQS